MRKASEMEVAFAEMAEAVGLYSEGEPGAEPAGEAAAATSTAGAFAGPPIDDGTDDSRLEPVGQVDVVALLIPDARRRWADLLRAVRDGGIGLLDLARCLGTIGEELVREELRLLAGTGDGLRDGTAEGAERDAGPTWLPGAADRLADFLRLQRLRRRLPDALSLRQSLQSLLATPLAEDTLGNQLERRASQLEREWSGYTLADVPSALAPLRAVFHDYDDAHLALLSLLAEAQRPLEWLLTKARSNDEFNKLLLVWCRPPSRGPPLPPRLPIPVTLTPGSCCPLLRPSLTVLPPSCAAVPTRTSLA